MRVDLAPFKDNRVRQALRLVVDRQQMLDVVFKGKGTIGNDIFGIWSPSYDHSIPQRTQDIDKAKSLLKSAGQSDLQLELITGDIQGGWSPPRRCSSSRPRRPASRRTSARSPPNQFFAAHNYTFWPFAQDWWFYNFYLPQVALTTFPGAPATRPTGPTPSTSSSTKRRSPT